MAPPSWLVSRPTRRKPAPVSLNETRLLRLIAHGRLVRTFIDGNPQYTAGGIVVPVRLAEDLIRRRVVLPLDLGLLDGVPQSWRVRRPAEGPE
jgi:hypothetical protein